MKHIIQTIRHTARAATVLLLALLATAQGAWADTETVSYIDADGKEQTVTATVLTGNEEPSRWGSIELDAGWYVVKGDISYTNQISYGSLSGTIHIILADGAQMSVECNGNAAISLWTYHPLAIYGQSAGTGRLSVTSGGIAIAAYGGITINGGIVSATSTGNGHSAIYADDVAITINGGQVTATPGDNAKGIGTVGTITLGLRSASDFITANGYNGTVNIKDGQTLYDQSGNAYTGNGVSIPDNATLRSWSPAHFSVNDAGTEYTIHTAEGWDYFCDLLADNTKGYFSGKTVHLGADITVTRMAGGENHEFTGTFDGGGHTLTLDYGTADAPVDAQFVAPFIETSADGDHQPTFCNLTIDGTIYATHTQATDHDHVGGLIGHLYGTVTIEDCTSLVEIHAKGGAGGFVGLCEHSVSFTNCHSAAVVHSAGGNNSGFVAWSRDTGWNINFTGCLFDGKLLQQNGSGASNGGFIGWKGNSKTVTITNSICAPAALAEGETMADGNSATFSREHADHAATITNCYYTATLGNAQGKARHTVTAGTDVTVAHAGVATHYATSGITAYKATGASADSDPFIAGLVYNNVLYAGSGDAVSLTLANSSGDAPAGYYYSGGYSASGGATLSGSTLTMADADVTVSVGALRSTGEAVAVSYIDADGILCDGQDAIALDGTESRLDAGWYFVGTDIEHNGRIDCYGDVNIILADDKTMTVSGGDDGIENGSSRTLTIYGQTLGTGTLNATGGNIGIFHYSGSVVICGGTVNATGTINVGIYAAGDVTINGGKVTATSTNIGIYANGSVTITGGQVTATGGQVTATGGQVTATGGIISNDGDITLCCTNFSDYIKVSSYSHLVNIAYGQTLFDEGGNEYSGEDVTIPDGKTLRPLENVLALDDAADNTAAIAAANDGERRNVILYGRTLYKDGAWNTLCLPFDLVLEDSPLDGDGVDVRTLSSSSFEDGTLTLNFTPATGEQALTTLRAGQPYIIKWDATGEHLTENDLVFLNAPVSLPLPAYVSTDYVDFYGTYAPQLLYESGTEKHNLYLGADNALYYPTAEGFHVNAFRAYFQLKNGLTCGEPTNPNAARAITLNFGDSSEAQGIGHTEITEITEKAGAWYDMQGRKLQGQPTKKGLYIHGSKKVVVK